MTGFLSKRFLLCPAAMGKNILITGGARSGKSAFAETYAQSLGPAPIYIATAQAGDGEMAARIAAHQARRGTEWRLIEEPLALTTILDESDRDGAPRLVDCLTLWLSNLLFNERDWEREARDLATCLNAQKAPVVLVTNEVGDGIVPENALARRFRDAAGRVNQVVAAASDEVYLTVAGQPLRVKPHAHDA